MSVKSGNSIDAQYVPNVVGSLFTPAATLNRAVITSATFHASSAITNLQVYIVPNGGSPSDENLIINRAVEVDESYSAPELIGQSIEVGGTLQASDGGAGGAAINFVGTYTSYDGNS